LGLIILKAQKKYISECEKSLINSDLGRAYFSGENSARNALLEGLKKGELFVVLSESKKFIGFYWIINQGAFHSYPYLHIIAIKEEYRGKGFGKTILKTIEDKLFKQYSKMFLVVADFNPQAKKFYKDLGYKEVGVIPDLYKSGISEYIMMKLRQ
jgi:ribosomal protein S18 acetylase RimI-like enzyme